MTEPLTIELVVQAQHPDTAQPLHAVHSLPTNALHRKSWSRHPPLPSADIPHQPPSCNPAVTNRSSPVHASIRVARDTLRTDQPEGLQAALPEAFATIGQGLIDHGASDGIINVVAR